MLAEGRLGSFHEAGACWSATIVGKTVAQLDARRL
jgi:hypothetical protein